MSNTSLSLVIVGMVVVTYLPRLLPFYLPASAARNQRLASVLELLPYTAIGALLFPGVVEAVNGSPAASLVGLTVAVLVAALTRIPIAVVVLAVLAVYIARLSGL